MKEDQYIFQKLFVNTENGTFKYTERDKELQSIYVSSL